VPLCWFDRSWRPVSWRVLAGGDAARDIGGMWALYRARFGLIVVRTFTFSAFVTSTDGGYWPALLRERC
jgi:hypothetical protein